MDDTLAMFGGSSATVLIALFAFGAYYHNKSVVRAKLNSEAREYIGNNINLNRDPYVQKRIADTLLDYTSDRKSPGQALGAALYNWVPPETVKTILRNMKASDLAHLEGIAAEAAQITPDSSGQVLPSDLEPLRRHFYEQFRHLANFGPPPQD